MLTAFLIESFQNLEEDPQQTVIDLLRQITAQTGNYTLTPGHLNSTAPLLAASSFTPRASDIRVNVCWFASLIFSLSTASFGILVKGWLKEYLAMYHMTYDVRLRIRHFRYTGLEDWKLFEIAAVLPLILQLSLALFFVGLCFFTASVNRSVGTTSIVLVSGWALFFIFALLAPILSSRCPYKTTFLKALLRAIRLHALPIIIYSAAKCKQYLQPVFGLVFSRTGTRRDVRRVEDGGSSYQELKNQVEESEENQIWKMDDNDVTIFAAIDSLLLNDKHLETMWAALRKTAGLDLAVEVVRRRLNLDTPRGDSFSWDPLLPLHDLPDSTWNIVLTIAVEDFWRLQRIQKRADQQNKDTAAWMERVFWFLASGISSDVDRKFPPK